MRHPFDGLNLPSESPQQPPTRRQALGAMAAAAAGIFGLASASRADQIATTGALGEEGAGDAPQVTTLALGEEGGGTPTVVKGPVTTEPFGEEAGSVTSRATPGLEDGKAMPLTKALREDGGVTTQAVGEEGGLTRERGEEGGLTKARGEEGGAVVKVEPLTTERTEKQLEAAWADLATAEADKAAQGCAVLYGSKQAVPFLKDRLKVKFPQADEKQVAGLITDLDSDTFAVREKAEKELAKLGLAVVPALQAALKKAGSAEVRMRLQRLLDKSKEQSVLLQAQRGLEVLVALRTPEAKEVLQGLAKGDEKEWLTQAAKEALVRMSK